jgi:hypothetical protein
MQMTAMEKEAFGMLMNVQEALLKQTATMHEALTHRQAITDATDWPMLVILVSLVVILIGSIWKMNQTQNKQIMQEVKDSESRVLTQITRNRIEYKDSITTVHEEVEKLWGAYRGIETKISKCRGRYLNEQKQTK